MIFTDLTDSLERAARNGRRAHLPPDLVRALVASPAYPLLIAERTKELVESWGDRHPAQPAPQADSSSGPTTSTTAPTEASGPSAGMIDPHVHVAAEGQAYEEATRLTHRRKRGRPLPASS